MSSIFGPDSALMRFLTRIADLMILNVIFLVTAIPIVTLGAALTGLNFTAMRIATDRDDSVIRDYFRSFRQNFRQATVIALVIFALAAVLGAWYIVVVNLDVDAFLGFVLLAIWYVVAFAVAVSVLFVFPYLAHFEGTTREVLRNARLLAWRHPLTSFLVFAIIALAVLVTVFSPQATGYGLLWLLIGFAGVAFLAGILFARVFEKYAPSPASEEE